ncbi:MAG TPA: methyltransferase domain-containing protein [bacterium]|nr:methyltransferase domain-containing protein [bacterium]HNZ73543.1 methyltransferase domain-containing protein [bacterium]HOH67543.1 methyltransferase domain-containing protein [bacterium]HQA63531.1 methyltransferase domain-containing protein [bacterium]
MDTKASKKILSETREIYNRIAPSFSDTRSKWWRGFGDFARYVQAGDKVIDIGCGNGRMAEIFTGKGISYWGVDASEKLIAIAKKRFKDYSGVRFMVGDILEADDWHLSEDEKNDFDLALMLAILHHLPGRIYQLQALENAGRRLKPGGRLVVSNWNLFQYKQFRRYWRQILNYRFKAGQYGVWSLKDAFIPWKLKDNWQMRYVHSFSKGELKGLLVAAGFEIEDIFYEHRGQRTDFWGGSNLMAIALKK